MGCPSAAFTPHKVGEQGALMLQHSFRFAVNPQPPINTLYHHSLSTHPTNTSTHIHISTHPLPHPHPLTTPSLNPPHPPSPTPTPTPTSSHHTPSTPGFSVLLGKSSSRWAAGSVKVPFSASSKPKSVMKAVGTQASRLVHLLLTGHLSLFEALSSHVRLLC